MPRQDATARKQPRGRRQRDRRAEILDTATRVFYEKGYGGTTIQDIADELNILKGSLYHYIRSKEDLLLQILMDGHGKMSENLVVLDQPDRSALTVIGEFVERHVMVHLENFMASRVFMHDIDAISPAARKKIVKRRDEYETAFRDVLIRGIEEGDLCPAIDTKLVAKAILTMLNSIHLWYVPGGDLTPERIAEEYADLVVASVRCSDVTHEPGHRRTSPGTTAG